MLCCRCLLADASNDATGTPKGIFHTYNLILVTHLAACIHTYTSWKISSSATRSACNLCISFIVSHNSSSAIKDLNSSHRYIRLRLPFSLHLALYSNSSPNRFLPGGSNISQPYRLMAGFPSFRYSFTECIITPKSLTKRRTWAFRVKADIRWVVVGDFAKPFKSKSGGAFIIVVVNYAMVFSSSHGVPPFRQSAPARYGEFWALCARTLPKKWPNECNPPQPNPFRHSHALKWKKRKD